MNAPERDFPAGLQPLREAESQAQEAKENLDRDPQEFLRFPWSDLDELTGRIGPGEIWFVGAYSGHGKTTFLMSALNAWFEQGRGVYYMGLESRPYVLRTQWACQRLGLNAGDVLTGKLQGSAEGEFTRRRILAEINAQMRDCGDERVYFSPKQYVDAAGLRSAAMQANALGSQVLIIDHVDHLTADGSGLYDQSVRSMKTLLEVTQEFGLIVLAATQFNNEMIRGNRLGMYTAPSATAVYMGNHKRHIATGMLGLYRPLKFRGLAPADIKKFAKGDMEPHRILEPNVMAVSLMKHRLYGNREGKRVFLKVHNGRVVDLPTSEQPDLRP
jgi:KaiC/GvpD/RAD55 family RecA-like ATPase